MLPGSHFSFLQVCAIPTIKCREELKVVRSIKAHLDNTHIELMDSSTLFQMCFDRDGNLVACETNTMHIKIFKRDGSFLTSFQFGKPEQGVKARGVAVDAEGKIFVACTDNRPVPSTVSVNSCVKVFAFEA